jgi:acyl-CoA synthetase (AMP-forming)/AMP-acid ligase II/thioesterase domain-containing protein/acyl carrier protein
MSQKTITGCDDDNTLHERLATLATRHGDVPALLDPEFPTLSFADLLHETEIMGSLLQKFGIGCGDRIALVASHGSETATAILAIACNAVCVPINPGITTSECLTILRATRARALFAPKADGIAALEAATQIGLMIIAGDAPASHSVTALSATPPGPDDPALLMVTSGTTDTPKVVPITHRQLLARVRKTARLLGLTAADRCLNLMPLYYMHGLNSGLLGPILAGGSSICPSGFDKQSFSAGLRALRATWYTAGATHQQAIQGWLTQAPEMIGGHSLRFARSGSASLPARIQQELERQLGVPVVESYSSTETGSMTANPPGGVRKPGTVGRGIGSELAVVGEQGELLPAGTLGEVVVRGPCIITAYENDPQASQRAFRNGWFHTGDLGRLDEDGYLTLGGRLNEIINRGGEKIAPAEVDAALLSHPAVADAITFSVPHPTLHEEVAAAVVLHPGHRLTEQGLRDYLGNSLAPFKVPRRILPVTEIAKGPTGKPLRTGLAKRFAAELEARPVSRQHQESPILQTLVQLWRNTLRRNDISPDDDFFQRGGDSLSAVELLTRIEEMLQLNIAIEELVHYPTPVLLGNAIINETVGITRDVLSLHADGTATPLFAICGRYGHGIRLMELGHRLNPNQPFYVLQPPGMDWGKAGYRDLPSMAAHYINVIQGIQSSGPYRLLGTSFGGLMVFEIARQLQLAGEEIKLLVMVDTGLPSYRLGQRIIAQKPVPERKPERDAKTATEAAGLRVAHAHVRAKDSYLLERPFEGELVYFMCMGETIVPRADRRRFWRHFATGGVRMLSLPGLHGEFHLEPQVSVLYRNLEKCLNDGNPPAGMVLASLFAPYRLVQGDKTLSLKAPFQAEIPVVGKAHGRLYGVHVDNQYLIVAGWAAAPHSSAPGDTTLLAFLDGRYLGRGECSILNRDIELAKKEPRFKYAGYILKLPLTQHAAFGDDANLQLYVISSDNRAAWVLGHCRISKNSPR